MSDIGKRALSWWAREIAPRDEGGARGLSARLRRAAPLGILSERAVHDLAADLGLGRAQVEDLVRLAGLLAEIRDHVPEPLARRLGGADPVLSPLRFQRLTRAEGEELTDHLRRAIVMAERRCNVAALAQDLLHWERARRDWWFDYHGADAPSKPLEEQPE